MPATTCCERVVTLSQEDIYKLQPCGQNSSGVLMSANELTLTRETLLGGKLIPAGLTIHGILRATGENIVRKGYWKRGNSRDNVWETKTDHGREECPVKSVAPIPRTLEGVDIGGDRVLDAETLMSKLKPNDTTSSSYTPTQLN